MTQFQIKILPNKISLMPKLQHDSSDMVWQNRSGFFQDRLILFLLGCLTIMLLSSFVIPTTYGWKLSVHEICTFCVTFCRFSPLPGVKMSHHRARKKITQLTSTPRRVMELHCFYWKLAQFKQLKLRICETLRNSWNISFTFSQTLNN